MCYSVLINHEIKSNDNYMYSCFVMSNEQFSKYQMNKKPKKGHNLRWASGNKQRMSR